MYHIPNDNYIDFRLNMFAEYYGKKHAHNDSDVYNLCSICSPKTPEDCVWTAFLFSTCYSAYTAALLNRIFPTIDSADEQSVQEFWDEYKQKLVFQSDRRYVKIMNKFPQIVRDFIKKFDGKSDILVNLSQENLYKWFNNIYYCGRFSTMLFIEALHGLLNRDLSQGFYLDWNACKTCAQGVFVICYQDDISDSVNKRPLSRAEISYVENMIPHIVSYTENFLGRRTNFARIVGYLCGYFKLYKQTRYLEFYTDRRLSELKHYETVLPEYMDLWKMGYDIRKRNVPNEILGELNGWNGVRKEKCKEFVMYGKI